MKPDDAMPLATAQPLPALDVVKLYHARSKHRFEAYAPGPGMLDWDAQPAPFRHYTGAPAQSLPLLADIAANDPLRAGVERRFGLDGHAPQPLGLASLGVLLNLALGLTAWKTLGPDRWAVRANPSSGNLHPVEAWLIARGIDGLADGVHHYRPEDHALELRAQDIGQPSAGACAMPAPGFQIALSTAMWREAWKYGERGFRYCQLDVGHAAGSLAHAAAVLGWTVQEIRTDTLSLARRLGLDRDGDFPPSRHPAAEREEAEMLLSVTCSATEHTAALANPLLATGDVLWFGMASKIDPAPLYRWPLIDEVAVATRRALAVEAAVTPALHVWQPAVVDTPPRAADVFLGRRSAQRFDASRRMSQDEFTGVMRVLGDRLQPGRFGRAVPDLMAAVFVHRVDALTPGLYLLSAGEGESRHDAGRKQHASIEHVAAIECRTGEIARLWRLREFEQVELYRLARSLHCHQDIAANACLALGLISAFNAPLAADPAAYRDLFRAAGQTGHALYLAAEAMGLRGTGIGCFFDDPVHTVLGLTDTRYQSLYHFTIGMPIDDARIEIGSPYPARRLAPAH
ncbi:SagB family peptide dehydrogenase [Azoarcus sp. L1K30]|uniref:SagB family peptide dehydrogenase n=1 Tax=Azoarcus sp. L1K30 TaxID=2820277 RepID=UPI001B814F4D|nr:SagB family peptide dehydrogenase [Azoarcus sp. L1K30]MBR0566542.1 SagB family peptide dehydrogenase [Azoarcus sp. L1K30]